MSTLTETVYLGRDNAIELVLSADGAVQDLTAVTQVDIVDSGCTWSVSSATSASAFDWSSNPTGGVLKMSLGDETIPAGTYRCKIVVYDPTNTDGVVWGEIRLAVIAACPAA